MAEEKKNLYNKFNIVKNLAYFKDKQEKNNYFQKLPEHVIENDIFSFLDSKELFFQVRCVSTEWCNVMKNLWCNKIKEEMIDQVKTIDLIYEKEVLTKTYEFKLEYLFNYRNLLTLYNSNTNVVNLIRTQVAEAIENTEFSKLMNLFFDFLGFYEAQELLLNNEINELNVFLGTDELPNHYTKVFQEMLNVEKFHDKNEPQLIHFREIFNTINKYEIEFISEPARLIYALLQGLVEFEILKHDIRNLNIKKKELIHKIQKTTNEWPRKKKFFERAYKLLLYSK